MQANLSQEDELDTIKAAQSGDAQAFARLLESYYDVIYRFAYKWTANQTNAEDITQIACIKLANSLKQFRFESAFSSWLYRMVINCSKDWQKSQGRHESCLDPADAPEASQANEPENERQLSQTLAFIATLGEGMQETAILVFAEGCSHKEAANILNIKESTVSWRIHEMRKKLQANQSAIEG